VTFVGLSLNASHSRAEKVERREELPVPVASKVLEGIPMPLNTRFTRIRPDICQKRYWIVPYSNRALKGFGIFKHKQEY
jgi:hypothetical protein